LVVRIGVSDFFVNEDWHAWHEDGVTRKSTPRQSSRGKVPESRGDEDEKKSPAQSRHNSRGLGRGIEFDGVFPARKRSWGSSKLKLKPPTYSTSRSELRKDSILKRYHRRKQKQGAFNGRTRRRDVLKRPLNLLFEERLMKGYMSELQQKVMGLIPGEKKRGKILPNEWKLLNHRRYW